MRLDEKTTHELEVIDAVVRGGGESRPDDAALVDFALLIRSARPLPSAVEAESVDERVRALRRPKKGREWSSGKALALGCTIVAMVAVVGGGLKAMSGGGQDFAADSSDSVAVPSSGGVAEDSAQQKAIAPEAAAPLQSNRSVRRDTALTLATDTSGVAGVADGVISVTDRFGGYVRWSDVSSSDATASARFDLLIPSDRYEEAMASLSELAHVKSRQQSTEDITSTVNRGRRSLTRAKQRVSRLEKEIASADPAEKPALERTLAAAKRAEQRARRTVAANRLQVDYAPVSVAVIADAAAARAGEGTVKRGLDIAWSVLQAIAAALVIALAVLAPVAVIALAVWLALRRSRRVAAERTLDAAAAGQSK